MRHVRDLFGTKVRAEPIDRNREGRAQIAIVEFVRWVAPHIRILHIANGGWRSPAEAARFKAMGVMAGAPDLLLILPGGRCAWWEVKASKGRLSAEQRVFAQGLEQLGHACAIVRSVEDGRRELAELGVQTREAKA